MKCRWIPSLQPMLLKPEVRSYRYWPVASVGRLCGRGFALHGVYNVAYDGEGRAVNVYFRSCLGGRIVKLLVCALNYVPGSTDIGMCADRIVA